MPRAIAKIWLTDQVQAEMLNIDESRGITHLRRLMNLVQHALLIVNKPSLSFAGKGNSFPVSVMTIFRQLSLSGQWVGISRGGPPNDLLGIRIRKIRKTAA